MVLVISFIDIILPSSNMRKYVKFILSIIFIAVILHPLMDFKNIEIDRMFTENMEEGYEKELEVEDVENIQQIQIVDLYKHKVKDEIECIIKEYSPEVIIKDVEVNIYENASKKNYGNVHSIDISLGDSIENNHERIIEGIATRLDVSKNKVKIRVSD